MSVAWRAIEPPPLPPLTLRERLRLGGRAGATVILTLCLVLLFVLARGVDLAARLLGRRGGGLAPWVVHAWGRAALPLAGLRYAQVGEPMAHPGALVANHASWLDIVVLMRATRVFFVSKAEVRDWPAVGLIGRAIGTVFIERRPAEAGRQQALLATRLRRGDRLVIFAEGTSTDGRRVLPFKSALFEAFLAPDLREEMWVQPVTLVYRVPAGLPATFYGWWGSMGFAAHVCDVLGRSRGGQVVAIFHAPLRARDFPSRKALADHAGAVVRRALEARLGAGAEAARVQPAPGPRPGHGVETPRGGCQT